MATDFKQFPFTELTAYRNKLRACAADVEATSVVVKRVSEQLSEETLVGRAGSSMQDALAGKLAPSLQRFYEKLMEEDSDIAAVIDTMANKVEPDTVRILTTKS
jgi:hypothetical protein